MKALSKKITLLLAVLLLALSAALFGACGQDTYTLTLDPNGGTIATTSLELKKGANVYDAVKGLVPVKDGVAFVAWYEGDEELSTSRTMPAKSLTLTAMYAGVVSYSANAPTDTRAQGTVADTVAALDGSAVVAENGYTITGYRFAGWGLSPSGAVAYAPGDAVTVEGTLRLYAIWDKGYIDRFGGNDYIYLPQQQPGAVILSRGSAEFKGTVTGNNFTFELPNGGALNGAVFRDTETFAYEQRNLAGTYTYRSTYYNPEDPENSFALDTTDTLTIDVYGTATHTYKSGVTTVTDNGIVTYYAASGEYIFIVTSGADAGSIFSFMMDRTDDPFTFYSSYGEAGMYFEFLTGDGVSGYYGEGNVVLDGYGNIYFYDSIFTGIYWIEDIYTNGSELMSYKISAILQDVNNQARDVLGFNTVDGYFGLSFYTMPIDATSYVYVTPKAEAGEYQSEDGTLVLDGYRLFGDSARYTDTSKNTYIGGYAVNATPHGELFVTVSVCDPETGMPTGRTFTFKLSADGDGDIGFALDDALETSVEYILIEDSAFAYELVLVIYDEIHNDMPNTKRAELLYELTGGSSDYVKAAEGYVEYTVLNGEGDMLYTFHRTALSYEPAAEKIPVLFTFMVSSTYDNSYFSRYVYYVFEYSYGTSEDDITEEVTRYTVVRDSESDAYVWYMDVGVNTMGSLYFDEYGDIHAGGFIVDTTSYYFGNVGIFVYYDSDFGGYIYLYFDLELDGSGKPAAYTQIYELEYPVYSMGANGVVDGTVRLILRGDEALWSANGFSTEVDDVERGRIRYNGTTEFGDDIVEIVNEDGIVVLTVVLDYISYLDVYSYVDIWVCYPYQANVHGEYTAAAGTLVTDGFRHASYTTSQSGVINVVYGDYTLSSDGKVLTFTAGGQVIHFMLAGTSFQILDGMYGEYDFYYLGEWYTLSFDGQGNLGAFIGNISVGDGFYNVIDPDTMTVTVFLDLGGEIVSLTLALGYDGFVQMNEALKGVFIGRDWAVLDINGYGSGTYYAADGSRGVTVYYDVINAADGYLALRDSNYNYYNFVLDSQTHSFRRPQVMGNVTYYAEDFTALAFSSDGEMTLQSGTGYYNVLEDTIRLYLQEGGINSYRVVDIQNPSAEGNCVVEGKTYYRWQGGSVTFTGTINLTDEGNDFHADATLTFTPDGDVQFYAKGTFTVGSESYSVYVVNQYWDYQTGMYKGLALYDESIYEYSPFTTYAFNPTNGTGTFEVNGGLMETKMYDGFEEDMESYLIERYIGFGPISVSERTASGSLYVGGGKTLTFEDAYIETVLYDSAEMGYRYMAVFEVEGTTYAMHYYKFDGDYWLFMIATYTVVETEGYAVGVSRYYYSNDGFSFPAYVTRGTPFNLVLYTVQGEERSLVVGYNSMFNGDGKSGWLLALGSYDIVNQTGEIGSIYTIVFADDTLQSVTVTEYTAQQATGSAPGASYFANFYLENDEIVGVAAVAINTSSGYEFLNYTSVEQSAEDENVWIFHATDGYDYTMTLLTDEEGNYVYDSTGEYWQITLTATAR